MKENQIRELVNELRDIAIEYHGTQQLREQIARTVRAAIIQAGNSPVIGIDMASEPDRSVDVRYLAPPGYVMVPKVVTPEIGNAINEVGQRCTCGNCSQRLWDLLLASAPVQVDIEMLASTLKNAPLAPSDNQGRPRAPVVPPAIEPDYKVIKSILPTANPDEYACCIAADMWNACRAAMLQGVEQPQNARQNIPENIPDGNSPAIPDGWIPVSERMPENKPGSYEYIVFESLNNRAHHDYWNVPDGSCDDFSPFWNHYGKYVTHWMPLPEPPQEEK
ncbi:DUF551 domain-containing protein [Salmonella enterica subsp. enterica serovar Muenchen]|nr:DUF551 domain-containing protein [Salmonella enterica subsp. enterica serovar Muenchen]